MIAATPSATLSGTVTPSATEAEIVSGGKTLIITLSNELWDVNVGADNAITQALIDGIDADGAESTGWDAAARPAIDHTNVVRTSDTVVTITLPAVGSYNISADETVTVTVPASAVQGPNPFVATPTFSLVAAAISAAVTGTITPSALESEVVTGGKTIIITLTNETWDAAIGQDNSQTTDLINGIDSAQSESNGWNVTVKAALDFNDVTRTSDTVVTVTMPAVAGYLITADETITVTAPATAVVGINPVVATPTFAVTNEGPQAAVSGTVVPTATEAEVVSGSQTVIITLTNDTWVAAGPTFDAVRQDIIDGLDSAGSEATGWNTEVRDKQGVGGVVRTSSTVVTITLDAQAAYDISVDETVTVTVPASSVTSATAMAASPTFDIIAAPISAAVSGTVVPSATEADVVAGSETVIITLTNETWVAAGATFDAVRQDIIDGLDSAQSESTGWNIEVRDKQTVGGVVRTSSTVVTITLDAQAAYDITVKETITVTVPVTAVVGLNGVGATPTFDIVPTAELLGGWVSGLTHAAEAGGNRVLIFTAHAEDGAAITTPTGVTYGGQTMTQIVAATITIGFSAHASSWYLNEAGIAGAGGSTFIVTWPTTPAVTGYASAFFGTVDQATPIGATDSNTSTASPISTVALAVTAGDMAMYAGTVGNIGTYSANNGFTEGIELVMSSSDGAAGQKLAVADGTETPSTSHSLVNRQVILGWVLQAAQ